MTNLAWRSVLVAGVLASMAGCDPPRVTSDDPLPEVTLDGPALVADSAVYHLRADEYYYRADIGFTYTNPTRHAVQVPTCQVPDPPSLQKWQDGGWVGAYFPVLLLCLGPPLVIEAGRSYRDTLHLSAGRRESYGPRFQVDPIPGRYRLVLSVVTVGTQGPEVLPIEQRVSAPFEIAE